MHYLMNKNIPVLEIETAKPLKIDKVPRAFLLDDLNCSHVNRWIRDRAIPINRRNSKLVYESKGLDGENDEISLMYLTHAPSINDNYWIADESEIGSLRYEDISLFKNSFNKSLYSIALTGKGTYKEDGSISPEFTGQGTFPKCFVKEDSGIYMYKHSNPDAIQNEIIASELGKVMGFRTASYERAYLFGTECTKSKIMSDESVNWETADSLVYAAGHSKYGIPQIYAIEQCTMDLCNMVVFDALVLNGDRHMKNWAFEYDAETNDLKGLAVSFDYNNCFTKGRPSNSNLLWDGYKSMNILRAARVAYRDYGITLNLNNLFNYISIVQLPINAEHLINRVNYITGVKNNTNDCFEQY